MSASDVYWRFQSGDAGDFLDHVIMPDRIAGVLRLPESAPGENPLHQHT